MDKVVATKNYRFQGQIVEIGKEYEIRKESGSNIDLGGVYVNNEWLCDVGSPLYDELFLKQHDEERETVIYLIKLACERLLDCDLLEENGWSERNIVLLEKISQKEFNIEFKE